MGIGDYSATDAENVTVPGSPPIEIGEGIGGGPTAHQTLRLAVQRIMADLKTLNGTIAGADGFDGTSAGLKYDFNNSTSVADPGTGKFALNNASPGSTTFISVDALTAATSNPDASDWVAAWDDGNGAIKGLVVITEIGAEQKFAIFKATAVVDNTNWLRVAVTHVASNGTFTNDVTCAIAFSPAGADGGDGDDGTDGNTILNGSGAPGGGTGSDGDFYMDTSGNNIYGPKASGSWGSATSIIGAPGDGSGDMVKSTYDTDDDGKVDAAVTADVAPWAGLTGVPASFTPSSHNHTASEVTDFNTTADARITAANLLADSELTNIAAVKGLDQGVATTDSPTFVQPTVKAVIETRFAVTGTTPAIDPVNGGIQTWTLSGASTPTDSLGDGESVTLHIDDGTANTVTWTSLVDEWIGGSAPTLPTTGYAVIELWKVNTTVYAAYLGDLS